MSKVVDLTFPILFATDDANPVIASNVSLLSDKNFKYHLIIHYHHTTSVVYRKYPNQIVFFVTPLEYLIV